MANRIPVPDELRHLLEKRDSEGRRKNSRRHAGNATAQQGTDKSPGGTGKPAERRQADRRRRARRQSDQG